MIVTDQGHLRWKIDWLLLVLGAIVGVLLASFLLPFRADAQDSSPTFTVNSTSDDADAKIGDGKCATVANVCTLRAAIVEANKRLGSDTIAFDITPSDGIQTIQLTKALPLLTDQSGPTTIDGYTQPGSSPNTDPLASNAAIKVELRGNGHDKTTGGFDALDIRSPGNTVRGLAFYNFQKSIRLYGSNASNNHITGNFIGTNANGTYHASTHVKLVANGVNLANGASSNTIGGTSVAERNVLSGNANHGVSLYDPGTNYNKIVGNLIGLDPSGSKRLANKAHGVDINSGASENVVGGASSGERNVISGNTAEGVELSHPNLADPSNPIFPVSNQVLGNFIGTNVNGESAPEYSYNGNHGVNIQDKAQKSKVNNNVIGNNRGGGIGIAGYGTKGSQVHDNWIGISPGGVAIPNGNEGILAANRASDSQIGPNNTIANNPVGIRIKDPETDRHTVTRNLIYNNTKLGIDIAPLDKVNANDPGDADTGANDQLNFPVLSSATQAQVGGTACADCNVEVFTADDAASANGEGKDFVGSVVAGADGSFTVQVTGLDVGDNVTATATDSAGNTSEFSRNLVVSG